MRRRRALLLLSALGAALILASGVASAALPQTFGPAPGSPFQVGDGPQATTTADFDGDGKKDLAATNSASDNISVLLGDGQGSFKTPAIDFAVGDGPADIKSADFNKDGKPDLAVTNFGPTGTPGTVSVLLNSYDGTGTTFDTGSFAAATNFAVGGNNPWGITSLDFNEDDNLDLAVANFYSNNVSVLLGDGTGSFDEPTASEVFPVGNNPVGITSASFNNCTSGAGCDSHPDLAVTNLFSDNISELFGNGQGGGLLRHDARMCPATPWGT
jgi:FG-GAP-like repeat